MKRSGCGRIWYQRRGDLLCLKQRALKALFKEAVSCDLMSKHSQSCISSPDAKK